MITTLNAYDVAAIPATGKRLILQDGNELVVDGIVKNLRFSPDSKLYAYSAEKDGKTSVVVNDRIIDQVTNGNRDPAKCHRVYRDTKQVKDDDS